MADNVSDFTTEGQAARRQKLVYRDTLPEDYSAFRHLLETYSKVPPAEVEAHISRIRDRAWAVAPYPCIGLFSWTDLSEFGRDPAMGEAVARLRDPGSGDALLDVGCCVGQTVRQLLAACLPADASARLLATDLHAEFWAVGYDLFRDRDRLPAAAFAAGDVLDADDEGLARLDGRVTLVHASHFLHLFSWEDQVRAAERMVRFLDVRRGNCLVFGQMVGSATRPGVRTSRGRTRFLHDQATFQRLWDEVGGRTGTAWAVEVDVLGPLPVDLGPAFAEGSGIRFAARQVPT